MKGSLQLAGKKMIKYVDGISSLHYSYLLTAFCRLV